MLIEKFERHHLRNKFPDTAGLTNIKGSSFYGEGYQDIPHRKPRIGNASRILNWRPSVKFSESLEKTLDYFLKQASGDKIK